MTELLKTEGLTVRYGGNIALDQVSITVRQGELVGLIGPNGAGKTTFIDALTGFTRSSGGVQFDGHDLTTLAPHRRVKRGLGRTWQSAELYDELSVRENLEVAGNAPALRRQLGQLFTGRTPSVPFVDEAARLLHLEALLDKSPDELTQGQRKSVDVARALVAGGKLLCLDEPAAGLDSDESHVFGRTLRGLVEAGTSLLLVDHDMGLVLGVCDRIYVLDLGRLIAEGTPDEIRRSPQVIEAYLGSADQEPTGEHAEEPTR